MKIFCIGLSKTGTHSLTEALRILGYDAVHWNFTSRAFRYTKGGIEIDWAFFDRHDAYSDTPIARIYQQLDARFPDAKFILTLRDPETWLDSFAAQFKSRRLDPFIRRLHQDLYDNQDFDGELCLAAFLRHIKQVRIHFATRAGKLLEIDIIAGDGWAPLCEFLGVEQPEHPFPWRFSRAERRQNNERESLYLHNRLFQAISRHMRKP